MPRNGIQCYVIVWNAMSYAMLCNGMQCYVTVCNAM